LSEGQGCENCYDINRKPARSVSKTFSKRGETLKMFFPAKLREKDFWLSALAGPAGP
jgi:hypothetical protein